MLRQRRTSRRKAPAVLGIDPSLRRSGYAYRQDGAIKSGTFGSDSLRSGARLYFMESYLRHILARVSPSLVVYEGYSYGSRGKVFEIGELGGVFKHLVYSSSIPMIIVPPSTLKIFFAGKGNADKAAMIESLRSRTGVTLKDDNRVDAIALMMLGEAYSTNKYTADNIEYIHNESLQSIAS